MADEDDATDSLRSIAFGAYYHVVGKVVAEGISFLLNLVLSRGLGAATYGVYAYALTICLACRQFVNLGSDRAALRFLPEQRDDERGRREIFTITLATSIGGGVLFAVALAALAPAISRYTLDSAELVLALRLFGAILFFNAVVKALSSTLRALERVQSEIFVEKIARQVTKLAFVGAALYAGYRLTGVLVAYLLATVLLAGVAVAALASETDVSVTLPESRERIAEYYDFSLPLTFKDAGTLLYTRVDVLMVGAFLSSTSVGIYNVSILLASTIILPLGAFNRLFPPIASELYADGDLAQLESVFETVTRWTIALSLPIFTLLVAFRTELLDLFGPEFAGGATVLLLFAAGQMANSITGPIGYTLMMTDHQYALFANQWAFGALNAILNYVLILNHGVLGAAIATSITYALLNVVRVAEVWYFERLFPFSTALYKPLVAAAAAAAVAYACRLVLSDLPLLVLGGAIGGATYFAALSLLRLEEEDRDLIRNLTQEVS